MTKPTNPKIPEDLLERCLATIPESAMATYRSSLSPDSASRTRLHWLSVAAAVPVVMVLAVLPVRQWLKARNTTLSLSTNQSINFVEIMQKQDYIRKQSWESDGLNISRKKGASDFSVSLFRKSNGSYNKYYKVAIMQRDKGVFSADTDADYRTPALDTSKQYLKGCFLLTKQGGDFFWIHSMHNAGKLKEKNWNNAFAARIKSTVLSSLTRYGGKNLVSRPPNQRVGKWQGQDVIIVEYLYKIPGEFSEKKSIHFDLCGRIAYFISPKTGLMLGERRYEWVEGKSKEALVGEAEYSYTSPEDESRYFDPKYIDSLAKRAKEEGYVGEN